MKNLRQGIHGETERECGVERQRESESLMINMLKILIRLPFEYEFIHATHISLQ